MFIMFDNVRIVSICEKTLSPLRSQRLMTESANDSCISQTVAFRRILVGAFAVHWRANKRGESLDDCVNVLYQCR